MSAFVAAERMNRASFISFGYSLSGMGSRKHSPSGMPQKSAFWGASADIDKRLSKFLKKTRGEMSFAQFSKVTGLTPSTLFRLEQCDQTITLRRLEPVLKRLKVTLWDVFGDGKK